jgi:hypothetical protein
MDIARPIINVYHNKLAIAVDWFVHADSAQSSGRYEQELTPLSSPQPSGMRCLHFSCSHPVVHQGNLDA